MHYIYESLLVGIYSCILYALVPIRDQTIGLFVVGFLKHYLANWIGIQDYYCSNGNACIRQHPTKTKYNATQLELIAESVAEGALFIILGTVLWMVEKNKFIVYFWIGVLLHLSFELTGIHRKICTHRCKSP